MHIFLGGSVPVFDEVILSFALMNKIQKVDAASGLLYCLIICKNLMW